VPKPPIDGHGRFWESLTAMGEDVYSHFEHILIKTNPLFALYGRFVFKGGKKKLTNRPIISLAVQVIG
jgi:hypothetical protein